MKKSIIIILVFLIIAASIRAYAVSLGVYTDGGAGQMTLKYSASGQQVHDNYLVGCGIMFQVPVKRVKSSSYKLYVGFYRVFIPRTTRLATDYNDTYRMNLINLLAYSL